MSGAPEAIRRSRSALKDPKRPAGTFIFLGPSGVGKTELSKALAEFLFGSEDALITFDMSEYMEKYAVSRLGGCALRATWATTRAASSRRLCAEALFGRAVRRDREGAPRCLQYPAPDSGGRAPHRCAGSQGRLPQHGHHHDVRTSVRAKSRKPGGMGFRHERGKLSDAEIKSRAMGELKKLFRPEFLNRVDEIVVFKSLSSEQIRGIVDLMVAELRNRLIGQGMSIELTDAAKDVLAKEGTDPIYGARPLRRAIQPLSRTRWPSSCWPRAGVPVTSCWSMRAKTASSPSPRVRAPFPSAPSASTWTCRPPRVRGAPPVAATAPLAAPTRALPPRATSWVVRDGCVEQPPRLFECLGHNSRSLSVPLLLGFGTERLRANVSQEGGCHPMGGSFPCRRFFLVSSLGRRRGRRSARRPASASP